MSIDINGHLRTVVQKETRRSGSENRRVSNHVTSVAVFAFDSYLFDESRG